MYDIAIIGAGPSGLTASMYASCYHLQHIVIGSIPGGQLLLAPHILNYPGFFGVTGKELSNQMVNQMKKLGGELVSGSVTTITKEGEGFKIITLGGISYESKAIILATGTERKKLHVPGEVEYTGLGVHYCATCEKQDYAEKVCGIVGGANSALQSAVEVAQVASHVYIIYRGRELRGDSIWLEQVEKNPHIEVLYTTQITEILGDKEKITKVKLQSLTKPGETTELSLDKIFIEIGGVPGTALVIPLGVAMDKGGFVHVDERLATNVPGIFAAGDMVSSALSIEQISTSVGLGARAANSAFAYVKQEKAPVVWGGSQIRR